MKLIIIVASIVLMSIVLVACTTPPQKSTTFVAPSQQGYDLHIDAKRHVASDRDFVVHHYCKMFEAGFVECQLYSSDAADAKLIGMEVVIGPELYESLSADEKKNWHHHEAEIARKEVAITLPGLSQEEQQKIADVLKPTYGKVVIVWDPSDLFPMDPHVVII